MMIRARLFMPALALTMIAGANLFADAVDSGALFMTIGPAALVFTCALGIRERWLLGAERDLRVAAESHARELAASREQLSSLLESTMDRVMVLDRNWRVTYVNQRAAGSSQEGRVVVGQSLFDQYPVLKGSDFERNYRAAMERQGSIEFEARFQPNGRWWEVHAHPTPEALSIFYREITDRKQAEDRLHYLAEHDDLTGLPTRRGFTKRLREALATVRSGTEVVVLYLDLDDFKVINDTLGHPLGDAVLKEMAAR